MNVESLMSPTSTVGASPSSEQPPSKKARYSSPRNNSHSPSKIQLRGQIDARDGEAKARPVISFAYDTDLYLVDPRLTMHYTKEYFKHINSYIYVLYSTEVVVAPSRAMQG